MSQTDEKIPAKTGLQVVGIETLQDIVDNFAENGILASEVSVQGFIFYQDRKSS